MPNAAQLKAAIDSGRTGDKVAHPDPAAAPLGVDAETGGAGPTAREVREALRLEQSRSWTHDRTPVLAIVVGGTVLSILLGGALARLGPPLVT